MVFTSHKCKQKTAHSRLKIEMLWDQSAITVLQLLNSGEILLSPFICYLKYKVVEIKIDN